MFTIVNLTIFIFFAELTFAAISLPNNNSNSGNSSSEDKNKLNQIKIEIEKNNFNKAYELSSLAVKNFNSNADIWNLHGYISRQKNLLDESKNAYIKALKINPNHLQALEYYGELYLKMKLPKQAKKLLIRLEELCVLNCVERDKLKKAINEFENN